MVTWRRSRQAAEPARQLTGPTCRPSASAGLVRRTGACVGATWTSPVLASIAGSCPCAASRAIALSSAIGNASRRNIRLAGRSLAACLFCSVPAAAERDQREPECNDGSSRARSAATRSLRTANLRTAFFCRLVLECRGAQRPSLCASLGRSGRVASGAERSWAERAS